MTRYVSPVRWVTRGRGGRASLLWMRLIGCLALLAFSVAFSAGALFPSATLSAQEASPVAEEGDAASRPGRRSDGPGGAGHRPRDELGRTDDWPRRPRRRN